MDYSYSLRYIYIHMNRSWITCMVKVSVIVVGLMLMASCGDSVRGYERVVIDTYHPTDSPAVTDTTLEFFDGEMNLLVFDEDSGTGFSARIDLSSGLEPGTYYIKVYSAKANIGYYTVRVITPEPGESLPDYDFPGSTSDDSSNEPDDALTGGIPLDAVDIGVGNANWVNRRLSDAADIDWLRLVLP